MDRHRDITDLIERNRAFEDRVGVRLDALYCSVEGPDDDGDLLLHLNGEMHAVSGTTIESDVDLVMSLYDERGRLVETESDYVPEDGFFGFHTFSFSAYLKKGPPARVRLFPKRS